MEKQQNSGHYGLLTATTMIIGIVVGSGIFFKADDVLKYTGGSIGLGVLVFCIGAMSIIFGSLSLIELSVRTKTNGGVIGYYEEFISKKIASGFGWFQTFVYYPTIQVVVAWVGAVYTCSFLGINSNLELEIIIALGYMVFFYGVNILSYKVGGHFQNITTIIKLVPLLGIAIVGLLITNVQPTIPEGIEIIQKSEVGLGWLAALAPIAFSYDGWIVATTISGEVKNPKKTMPLALIIGPLGVLLVYILYFTGFSKLLGTEYIMSMGNQAVNEAGIFIFGSNGVKIMLFFVIIAVLGVVNGLTLGGIRLPHALACKGMLPYSHKITPVHGKYKLSIPSSAISFCTAVVWLLIHYFTMKSGILGGSDISEIAIVFSYICYVFLYLQVLKMRKNNIIQSKFKGFVCPIFALLGSLCITVGGIISNFVYVPIFIVICFVICYAGYRFMKKAEA